MSFNTEYRTILDREWTWPKKDRKAWSYLTLPGHLNFPNEIASMIDSHRTVIQAGGHCGLYPYQYTKIFNSVYTFEPETVNHYCLVENTKSAKNIKINNVGLGNKFEQKNIVLDRKNTGKHMISEEAGNTKIITIDSLDVKDVDLIHFDLEGYELFALQGAINTIQKYKPLIVLETNNLCLKFGYSLEDLDNWIYSIGYKKIKTWEDDTAYCAV
jgi:FkbM family methyltransferase